MRALGNPAILKNQAISALQAWRVIEELLEDERVDLAVEPEGFDQIFPAILRYRVPAGKLVGDAYLAAFPMGSGMALATFDKGLPAIQGLGCRALIARVVIRGRSNISKPCSPA